MFIKFLFSFLGALAVWGWMAIVSIPFGLHKMEIGSWEWWTACGVIGIGSAGLVEYFMKRKKEEKVDDEA